MPARNLSYCAKQWPVADSPINHACDRAPGHDGPCRCGCGDTPQPEPQDDPTLDAILAAPGMSMRAGVEHADLTRRPFAYAHQLIDPAMLEAAYEATAVLAYALEAACRALRAAPPGYRLVGRPTYVITVVQGTEPVTTKES